LQSKVDTKTNHIARSQQAPVRKQLQQKVSSRQCVWARKYWAEARIKIARMTLTIKLDRNWSSFQLANSAPPLSVTDSAIAPSARIALGAAGVACARQFKSKGGSSFRCRAACLNPSRFLAPADVLRSQNPTRTSEKFMYCLWSGVAATLQHPIKVAGLRPAERCECLVCCTLIMLPRRNLC
jgi:hypothetical protein